MHGSFQGLEQRAVTRATRSGEAGDERREDRHDDVHHALQGFLRRFFHSLKAGQDFKEFFILHSSL